MNPETSTHETSTDELEQLSELLQTPFDPVLADATRLRLMAALIGLPEGGTITFTSLTKLLQLTAGNLGAHLAVLEDAGYLRSSETWRGKRRTRWFAPTGVGRDAFDSHVVGLQAVISAAEKPVH